MPTAPDKKNYDSYEAPASDGLAVTPSDGTALTVIARALWIGVAGNVSVVTLGGTTLTFVGVQAGSILPVRCTHVRATLTTATSILALW
ncbi:MAG: hypothetical protein V4636_13140 [Pseudomonadota bacterium]